MWPALVAALALGLGLPGAVGVASAHHGSTSTTCPATTTVIPGGTIYTLTHDVLGCSVTAFHVGAGATLDLNGFRISGTSTNTAVGVKVTGDFAIVTSTHPTNAGIIEDFGAGVEVRNRYFAVVSNLTVRDNNNGASSPTGSPGEGIALWNTVKTTVENNTVCGNGPYAGIGVYGTSSGNEIRTNIVCNNNLNRPVAGGGSNNETIGIRLDQLTSGTIVDGNTVTDSGLHGIAVLGTANSITNNAASGHGWGPGWDLYERPPCDNMWSNNTGTRNDAACID